MRIMSRYFSASISVLSLFICISSVWGISGDHGITFLYPVDGLDVHYLDSVNVSWTSNFSEPRMYTFCINAVSQATITEQVDNVPTNGSKVYVMNYTNVTTCNWDLRGKEGRPGNGLNSPNFLLNPTQRALPSTFALTQATATPSPSYSSTPPPSVTDAPETASPSPINPYKQPKKQMRAGVLAGLVIGILVGVIAIAILGFCLHRRRDRTQLTNDKPGSSDNESHPKLHSISTVSGGSQVWPSPSLAYPPALETFHAVAPSRPSGSIMQTPNSAYTHQYSNHDIQQPSERSIELPKTPIAAAQELSTTTSRDRAVELFAPLPVHEMGPSRNENTGYNFPPDKTAIC